MCWQDGYLRNLHVSLRLVGRYVPKQRRQGRLTRTRAERGSPMGDGGLLGTYGMVAAIGVDCHISACSCCTLTVTQAKSLVMHSRAATEHPRHPVVPPELPKGWEETGVTADSAHHSACRLGHPPLTWNTTSSGTGHLKS